MLSGARQRSNDDDQLLDEMSARTRFPSHTFLDNHNRSGLI